MPSQKLNVPEIAPGVGFTVTLAVVNPLPISYVITATPLATPVTTPDVPTVAIAAFELLHMPPAGLPVREVI